MKELQEKLNELLEKISAKSSLGEKLTDDDTDQLDEWNHQAKALKARIEAEELSVKHAEDEKARIEAEKQAAIKAALQEQENKFKAQNNRLPFGEAPYQAEYRDTNKYDQLDAVELSLFMETAAKLNVPLQPGAYKAMSFRVAELRREDGKDEEERKAISYVKNAFKAQTGILPEKETIEAAIKADAAPMYTGASPMSDWVGTMYSQEIWSKIRGAVVVANRMPTRTIPDGYASDIIPLESTDPVFYKVAEAAATDSTLRVPDATVTSSAAATAKKTVTLGKMGARVLYSGEAVEDSIIQFVPQLRAQLEKQGAEQLEHVIVDGDVDFSANTNINDITSTPDGDETYLLFDGFRKLALLGNSAANARSASGGFVVEDFLATLQLLGVAGVAGLDPRQTAFIVDYNTYYASLNLPELKTQDTFRMATLENGALTSIYNRDVLPSFQMHLRAGTGYERKANTAGKVDQTTASNNTTGSILAVNFSQWLLAYKRRMTMEVTRLARSDSWEIVSLMRFGLAYRDTEASAITYNVAV